MELPLLERECILLAAGESKRMGTAKQLLTINGIPLLRLVLERTLAVCRRVIVVSGAVELGDLLPDSPRVSLVRNPDFAAGQLGSLQCGLRTLREPRAFIMLADLPLIRPETFRRLEKEAGTAAAGYPICDGRRGHPVIVGAAGIELLLAASPDDRAMRVIAPLNPAEVAVDDPGIYLDADTPEAWKEITAIIGGD